MSRRARRLAAALAALVLLLFAGRWTAGLLADRWWAAEISPAAARFLTDWHALRLTLDAAGILIASAWFVGHMLIVYRAVGSVQVRRNVANLEFREALTPGALFTGAIVAGVLLGLLVGGGHSEAWAQLALGWQGVTYGVAEPVLGRDVSVYVAQLPVWRAAHAFLILLIAIGLGVVGLLYLMVGAIRWLGGRPAINDHARTHLGWLLAALGLALAWGYMLEPYERVGGLADPLDRAGWDVLGIVSPVLAGVALATAALSAAWAARPRHALIAAGWIVLALASIVGHWLVPAAAPPSAGRVERRPDLPPLAAMAYGLEALRDRRLEPSGPVTPPPVPSLWSAAVVARAFSADSSDAFWADQVALPILGQPRAAWLVLRPARAGHLAVAALADDRVSPRGETLFYHPDDTMPHPVSRALFDLPPGASRPDAPRVSFGSAGDPGVPVESWLRRVVLAWALQSGRPLSEAGPGLRVDWYLSPTERLDRLAPFAEWGTPYAEVLDSELVWLVDGYLTSATFPQSPRLAWRGRRVGSVRAGFLATVAARDGETHIYLRPGADRVAEAWRTIASGVIESSTAIPERVLEAAAYPTELFRTQAQVIEQAMGPPASPGRMSPAEEPPATESAWAADTSGPVRIATLELPGQRRLDGLLLGLREQGREVPEVIRLDSAVSLPTAGALEARWTRFPSFDALGDSIRDAGGRLERGTVRYTVSPGGVVAYQPYYTRRTGGATAVVWVSVAAGDRLGAGRTLHEAWSNLVGAAGPSLVGPPGVAGDRLDEARRWLQSADSALRAGDWTGFGRAWSALRGTLGASAPAGP